MSTKTLGTTLSPPPIINRKVSLTDATKRVKKWLHFVSGLKFPSKDIPRAIYISMEDINQLQSGFSLAKKQGKIGADVELLGIRLYFGLGGESESAEVTQLGGLLVPVIKKDGTAHDAIKYSVDGTDSNIYDFTTPCPAYCDPGSDLGKLEPSVKIN